MSTLPVVPNHLVGHDMTPRILWLTLEHKYPSAARTDTWNQYKEKVRPCIQSWIEQWKRNDKEKGDIHDLMTATIQMFDDTFFSGTLASRLEYEFGHYGEATSCRRVNDRYRWIDGLATRPAHFEITIEFAKTDSESDIARALLQEMCCAYIFRHQCTCALPACVALQETSMGKTGHGLHWQTLARGVGEMLSGLEGRKITLDRIGRAVSEYKVSKVLPTTEYLEAAFSKSEVDELSSLLQMVDKKGEGPRGVRQWYKGGVVVEKGAND